MKMEYYYNQPHPGNPGATTSRDHDVVGLTLEHVHPRSLEGKYLRKLYGGERWFFLREGDKILHVIKDKEKETIEYNFLPSMLKVKSAILFDPCKSIKDNALAMLGVIKGVLHDSGTITIPRHRGQQPGGVALINAWPFMYPLYHTESMIYRCLRWDWTKATNNIFMQVDNRGDRKQGEKKSYLMLKLGTYKDGRGRQQVVWERAHRVVVWALSGGIDGVVMHTCGDERCVNPAHLFVGSQEHNTQKSYLVAMNKRRHLVKEVNGGDWEWGDGFDWSQHKPPQGG